MPISSLILKDNHTVISITIRVRVLESSPNLKINLFWDFFSPVLYSLVIFSGPGREIVST